MERDLIDATIKKFTRPVFELDEHLLQERYATVLLTKDAALADAGLETRDMLMSNPQFADALMALGVVPPTKISPRTGRETYAFAKNDHAFKELLEHDDLRVQSLVAARLQLKSTQEETRLKRFISLAQTSDKVGIPLLYYGAHTGRMSGWDKLNLQNLPRGSALRRSLKAPEGYSVVAGDLSQIEARITACLAGQDDLVAQFARGEDVYVNFGRRIFNKDEITKEERFVAKTCILGLGFQVGGNKLFETLRAGDADITDNAAMQYVNTYRQTYRKIPDLWYELQDLIPYMANNGFKQLGPIITGPGCIVLPNGMRLNYPELEKRDDGWSYLYRGTRVKLYGGKLCENLVQALARIIIATIEHRLYTRGWLSALQVHDELVYVVRTAQAEQFAKALERAMTIPVEWMPDLPLACEVGIGPNYAEAK